MGTFRSSYASSPTMRARGSTHWTPIPEVPKIAEVVADFHHRFQWIHPFRDTNGRTGRVIDTYVLWVTFGLAGSDLASSPVIEPFPTERHEDEYYEGLAEADVGSKARLRAYYVDRIVAAFDSMTTRSDPPPRA